MDLCIERLMNYMNRRLVTKQFIKEGVTYFPSYLPNRHIYEHVFRRYAEGPVDYLEFGVADGGSMRVALSNLGSESRCFGFDSFEGLPEGWFGNFQKGTFSREGGAIPDFTAINLTFIKGWFEESLQPFLASTPLKSRLILLLDADLYSSTIFVLRTMKDLLIPGTIVMFDEYWFLRDEFRALEDFVRETGKQFEYIVVTDSRAAIRFVA